MIAMKVTDADTSDLLDSAAYSDLTK
jgi:hypothetical protein